MKVLDLHDKTGDRAVVISSHNDMFIRTMIVNAWNVEGLVLLTKREAARLLWFCLRHILGV